MRRFGRGNRHPVNLRRLLWLDAVRAAFVLAAVGYVAAGAGSAVNLAFSSAAVVAIRFVALPQPYELAFILSMGLTGWGDALGLYDRFSHY